ncbi:MAG TPA: cellulose synthase operon protein YhjQ/BcsQ [Terracidiphilus sp.]|nr:cellulose synthase operon protein YhjQ/BcsQ [Terracidiphilus sp.]
MSEPNPQSDQNAAPEDVATLYSWANLHGAKYRDFSAARAQTRERARLRAEQAKEEEPRQSEPEAAAQGAEGERAAEDAHAVEQTEQALAGQDQVELEHAQQEKTEQEQAQQEQMQQAELAAEEAAGQADRSAQVTAAQQATEQAARVEAEQAARRDAQEAAELAATQAAQEAAERAVQCAAEQAAAQQSSQQRTWQQQPPAVRFPAMPAAGPGAPFSPQPAQKAEYEGYVQPPAYRPFGSQFSGPFSGPLSGLPQSKPPQPGPVPSETARQESPAPLDPWAAPEVQEPAGRPAWLSPDTADGASALAPQFGLPAAPFALPQFPLAPSRVTFAPPPGPASLPPGPEDTLQGSRDRLTSRWFALRGVFDGNTAAAEALPAAAVKRPAAMAVFSLAGGVGKTSLVATLGRALSARGERVLLVDTAAFGLLPFFFGATDQRPGQLRTFTPPDDSSDAPIQMVTIDPEDPGAEPLSQEGLSGEILKFAHGAGRVIIDLDTASGATTRRIMRMAPLVLVPVIADMNSVVSVSSIDSFFERDNNSAGKPVLPYYVLNQFDASLPLHLDVREVLREQLGQRLLPFALRRAAAMSEALAEGMTVMDYAPGSTLAEDFNTLAGWVKSLSAPAAANYRGVRWSER